MVAPSVPCSLLVPVAPHSLSFRPLVVPEQSVSHLFPVQLWGQSYFTLL